MSGMFLYLQYKWGDITCNSIIPVFCDDFQYHSIYMLRFIHSIAKIVFSLKEIMKLKVNETVLFFQVGALMVPCNQG